VGGYLGWINPGEMGGKKSRENEKNKEFVRKIIFLEGEEKKEGGAEKGTKSSLS